LFFQEVEKGIGSTGRHYKKAQKAKNKRKQHSEKSFN
jgi:hypothetical protein